ncbi:MAG: PEGA domain-containing protein, partial [Xanthomonadales bacterium]|nr:PEGA domain-containing protein [Xanthomonadales bacterium]
MNDALRPESHETIAPEDFEPSGGHTGSGGWVPRALLGLVFLALFLLTFGAWYLFTGKSVRVAFEPTPEQMALDGGLLRINLGDRWLLRPGEYQVTAELAGYHPFEATIEVGEEPDQQFEFALDRLPTELNVVVVPEVPAEVRIDGEPVGSAPLGSLELEEGTYEFVVEAERFQLLETTVEIAGGGNTRNLELELTPDWADVTVVSDPPGATLHVDDEPVGETPLTAEVLSGRHELELRLEGYKPWSEPLTVEALQVVELPPVSLEKADHIVNLTSIPGGASVAVDGEYRGQTPLQLALRPGRDYRLVFSKPGYRSNNRNLEVVQGDATRLAVRLDPILGTVIVEGSPVDAEIHIDGTLRGLVNEPIELPAHPHRIEVRREGYQTRSVTVTPNPDVTQRVELALISDAAIERARMPEVLETAIGYDLKLFRPSGIFRMGSPRREQGRRSNEFMRQVQLQRPFYVGLHEVTNEQFARFSAEHDSGVYERETLSLKQQPVVRVGWEDAARFCNWLSAEAGLPAAYEQVDGRMVPVKPMNTGFRLPTEAEWAYVARYEANPEGRAALKYPWGEEMPPPSGSGNFAGREAAELVDHVLSSYSDPHATTAQVGEYGANSVG